MAGSAGWLAFQGRSEWNAIHNELQLAGEPLTIAEITPPPIPDEDNFYADPLWEELLVQDTKDNVESAPSRLALLSAPLTPEQITRIESLFPEFAPLDPTKNPNDLIRDLHSGQALMPARAAEATLEILSHLNPLFERLVELAERQHAKFPVDFDEGIGASLPHLKPLLETARLLAHRSQAQIALSALNESHRDLKTVFRLADIAKEEPLLISFLVRVTILSLAADLMEKCLPYWNETTLHELHLAWRDEDLISGAIQSLRTERVQILQSLNTVTRDSNIFNVFYANETTSGI